MLSYRFEFTDIDQKTRALIAKLDDRTNIHRIAGNTLFNRTKTRFLNETAPDGTKWQALSPLTLIGRGKQAKGILRLTGDLFQSLSFSHDANKAEVGTNLNHPKVLVHQYGATIKPRQKKALSIPKSKGANRGIFVKSAKIPARPYIGIGKGDEEAVEKALLAYLQSE